MELEHSGTSVSPVAAGFIGAIVTIVLASAVFAAMWTLGMLAIGKKGSRQRSRQQQRWSGSEQVFPLPAYDSKTGALS